MYLKFHFNDCAWKEVVLHKMCKYIKQGTNWIIGHKFIKLHNNDYESNN